MIEQPCLPGCPAGECANCARFDLKQPRRKPQHNSWTEEEDRVVMENYRSRGWAYCQGLLATKRTEDAIRARAIYLERVARGGAPRDRVREERGARKTGEPGRRHQAYMAAQGRKFHDIRRAPRVSSIFNLAQGITV